MTARPPEADAGSRCDPACAETASLELASEAFDDAQLRHDAAAIRAWLAPDFSYVTRDGGRYDAEAFIAATTASDEVLEPFKIADHRVHRIAADAGIATGLATVRGTRSDRPFVDHFRYVDVFAQRDGRWTVVFVQVTARQASE